jgi:carbamoyl-phosphate synthase large subunit
MVEYRPICYTLDVIEKAQDGSTQIVGLIRAGKIQLVLNTPLGPHAHTDGVEIRKAAIAMNVPLLTTLSAAMAAVSAIQALGKKELRYRSLQSHFGDRHISFLLTVLKYVLLYK